MGKYVGGYKKKPKKLYGIAKWIKACKNISEAGKLGICPFCESCNTDYIYVVVSAGRGYFQAWCNDCHRACHVCTSGTPEKGKYIHNSEYPNYIMKHRSFNAKFC